MSRPENEFPTFRDLHLAIAELIERGFGDLPFQLVVAPDSTLQTLARSAGASDDAKPALMIEYEPRDGRCPVSIISTARLSGSKPRSAVQ